MDELKLYVDGFSSHNINKRYLPQILFPVDFRNEPKAVE